MNLLKDGLALALAVACLLTIPQEKLAFWFADRPQAWYGEFVIPGIDQEFILIKNQSSNEVDLRSPTSRILAGRSLASSTHFPSDTLIRVPPNSYMLISEARIEGSKHRGFTGSTGDFKPPSLYIATEGEDDISIILLFLGSALFAGLGFSIGLFYHEAAAVPRESKIVHRFPLRARTLHSRGEHQG